MGLISRVSSRTYRKIVKMATDATVVPVTRADQEKINTFARKHQSNLEIKSEISKIQLEIQKINDALEEIELHDDETDGKIPYQMGDLYVFLSQEEAQEYMEGEKAVGQKKQQGLESQKKENDQILAQLKQDLYGKFGKDINLEEDA